MFGYIVVHQPELKFREFAEYKSYYCGLCKDLKCKYGAKGQMTLSYDMTFLAMLLTGLYEPETVRDTCRCIAHPLEKHPTSRNAYTQYAADVNMILTYYKCLDDWQDERKLGRYFFASMLRKKNNQIAKAYPEKVLTVTHNLEKIHELEQAEGASLDELSGAFGEIMGQLFAPHEDAWADALRRLGFFLGKFIYIMDAYDDIEKDLKKKTFNPFVAIYQNDGFDEDIKQILTMMMAECSREFEKLPILENADILRNILYAGVWDRYELIRLRRRKGHCENEGCNPKECRHEVHTDDMDRQDAAEDTSVEEREA